MRKLKKSTTKISKKKKRKKEREGAGNTGRDSKTSKWECRTSQKNDPLELKRQKDFTVPEKG